MAAYGGGKSMGGLFITIPNLSILLITADYPR
jgi:hypothetical protein